MGVEYMGVVGRMKESGKLKNESKIARVLGVTPQALSNYKKRGEMPSDLVLRFARIYGLSVDWLITGESDMYKPGLYKAEDYTPVSAHEEASSYGLSGEVTNVGKLASLTPEEIVYVGRLLKVLRSSNDGARKAVKCSIDAFLKEAD